MARRRIRGLPEPPAAPPKLLVEENPNWAAAEDRPLAAPAGGAPWWEEEDAAEFDSPEEEMPGTSTPVTEVAESEPLLEVAPETIEDPNAAVIQQLMEDNRDLKAALCRLIRISEQNEAALRLLEEENEELSALVHRLTIGQTKAVPAATTPLMRPWWQRGWGGEWLKRQAQRCI